MLSVPPPPPVRARVRLLTLGGAGRRTVHVRDEGVLSRVRVPVPGVCHPLWARLSFQGLVTLGLVLRPPAGLAWAGCHLSLWGRGALQPV